MPELPEVETIVRQLNRKVKGEIIKDIWSDWKKMFKGNIRYPRARRLLKDKKIIKAERRGKNIFIYCSSSIICWVHLKMTGHFLLGDFHRQKNKWLPTKRGALNDSQNRFIHLVITFKSGRMLALSDLRKFARITILTNNPREDANYLDRLISLGGDPTSRKFTFKKFKQIVLTKKRTIKSILMDQKLISGIGNIYANEILWAAKINPWKKGNDFHDDKELKKLWLAIKSILKKAIHYKGSSVADDSYRMLNGHSGRYKPFLKIYQREGQPCLRCGTIIKRGKINNRSTFYCPKCQK